MYLRFNVVIEQCPKYALLRCKIFGLKFRRCKTLDKYHVYTHIAIVEWIIKSFLFSKILRESLKKFAQFMPLFPKLEVDSMQKKILDKYLGFYDRIGIIEAGTFSLRP